MSFGVSKCQSKMGQAKEEKLSIEGILSLVGALRVGRGGAGGARR